MIDLNQRLPPQNPIILIPARLQAHRLPGKPLADIAGQPMIVHVWRRAMESKIGRVVVAASDVEIVRAIEKAGGEAVLTDAALPTGSDRIHQALTRLDAAKKHDAVINVQGDVPTIPVLYIKTAYNLLSDASVDIATLISPLSDQNDIQASQVVKAIVEIDADAKHGRALYFTRIPAPSGKGPYYGHVGLYAYRRAALDYFVSQPQGVLERRESLEQLRALGLGLHMQAGLVDTFPLGVDTPEDLEKARKILT